MPIIRTYDMSTIEKVQDTYKEMGNVSENEKYKNYEPKDIMLVRTTNIFPKNRILKTLANSSFIAKSSINFICDAYQYEFDKEVVEKLETYQMFYRSTIHFAENGLVSSHLYGNFDNQDFSILEPLINQLDKSDFKNFAGQDTFIQGNVELSNEAIIIIKKDKYERIKNEYPEIDNFNVILYEGIKKEVKEEYLKKQDNSMASFDVNDERAIVERVLIDLGYVPELIGNHYIIESPTSNKIRKVNLSLGEKYKTNAETKHNHTEEYIIDFEKTMEIVKLFDKELLMFFINKYNLKMIDIIPNKFTAMQILNSINIEEVINTIKEFNSTIKKMQEEKVLPISEEIIDNMPNIYEYYVNNLCMNGQKIL